MAGDGFFGSAVKLCQGLGYIAVGGAVIAQALNSVFFIPLIGNAVQLPLQRNGGVEGCLKGADQHGVRRQLLELADGFQVGDVVSGSHDQIFLHALQYLWG